MPLPDAFHSTSVIGGGALVHLWKWYPPVSSHPLPLLGPCFLPPILYLFFILTQLVPQLTSTIFILTLAGTDLFTCLVTIPFTIAMEQLEFNTDSDLVCKVYQFLVMTTVPFSAVVIIAIAVDRSVTHYS